MNLTTKGAGRIRSCRKRSVTPTILLFLSVAASGFSAGEQQIDREYSIPGRGVLKLRVPEVWLEEVRQPPDNLPPTIIFTPAEGKSIRVLVTVFENLKREPDFNQPQKLRQMMEQRGQELLSTAEETELELRGLRGPVCWGYYFSLTDKAPQPGEYKHLTQGALGTGDLLLSFTILANEAKSPVAKDAINMLRSARQEASINQEAAARKNEIVKHYRCGLPNFKMLVALAVSAGEKLHEIKDTRLEYEILLNTCNIIAKETAQGIEVRLTADDLLKGERLLNAYMENAEELESASPTIGLSETDYKIKEALLKELKREIGFLNDTSDRNLSSLANALQGHWIEKDTGLELYYNDAGWLILVWPDSSTGRLLKKVEISRKELPSRNIVVTAYGENDSSIELDGVFSENFRQFSGLMFSQGGEKPFPFEFIYFDNEPVP